AGDGGRRQDQAEGAARGWRRVGQQPADAIPVTPPGSSGRPTESHRDHGAGRGVSRGIGRRLLEGPEADRGAVAGRPSLYTRDETRATHAARGRLAQGARAGQAMGRDGVRLGEAPWKSSSGETTSK